MVCLLKYIKADRRLNYVLWRLLNDLSNILVAALVIYCFSPSNKRTGSKLSDRRYEELRFLAMKQLPLLLRFTRE